MQSYLQTIPTDLLCEQVKITTDLGDIYQLLATIEEISSDRVSTAKSCVTSIRSNKRNLPYNGFGLLTEFPNLVELRLPVQVSSLEQAIQLASLPKLRSAVLHILSNLVSAATFVVSPEIFSELVRSFIVAYVASNKVLLGSAIYFVVPGNMLLSIVENSLTIDGSVDKIDTDIFDLVHKAGLRELWIRYNNSIEIPELVWDRLHLIFNLKDPILPYFSEGIRNLYGAIQCKAIQLHLFNRGGGSIFEYKLSSLRSYLNEVTIRGKYIADYVPLLEIADFPFLSVEPLDLYPNLKRVCFLVSDLASVENILSNLRLAGIEVVFIRFPGSSPIPGVESIPEFPIETYIKQLQF